MTLLCNKLVDYALQVGEPKNIVGAKALQDYAYAVSNQAVPFPQAVEAISRVLREAGISFKTHVHKENNWSLEVLD